VPFAFFQYVITNFADKKYSESSHRYFFKEIAIKRFFVKRFAVQACTCGCVCFLFFSCVGFKARSLQERAPRKGEGGVQEETSIVIAESGIKSAESLAAFFMNEVPSADTQKVRRLARLYVDEGVLEGINSDVAFAQMCLETGFLRFGGLVTEDMHNFCGLGALNTEQRGNRFSSEQEGVRAHIQHLKAYGSTEQPRMPIVDPRYRWVEPKGRAPTVHGLSGTWAADPRYGEKLADILQRMAAF